MPEPGVAREPRIIDDRTAATPNSSLLGSQSPWRFLRGFERFDFERPCVTVFGSARLGEHHRHHGVAREPGLALADARCAVMAGGGPGIAEAVNRGAKEAGGLTLACNIRPLI